MEDEFGKITEAGLAKLRELRGVTMRAREPYYNTEATLDTIQHFCQGYGDDNPLYNDREYAKGTRYGALVAPPLFLYSVLWGTQFGLPGVHAWYSGGEWEFFKPILEGDTFTYAEVFEDIIMKESKMAKKTGIQYSKTTYKNQKDEVVATHRFWGIRAEREAARETGKYAAIEKGTYTAEEMKAIKQDYYNEEVRGANTRYWEDVEEGEELTPVVKGPLSARDCIAWCMGAGTPFMRAHRLAIKYYDRHPALAQNVSETGEADVPELVHFDASFAEDIGLPGAYDYGHQRITWLSHLMTNWMGDEGWLKKHRAELRRFNCYGDTTWCKGKVTKKYVDENGEHCVDIDCYGINQRGEINMPGQATVILPSREKGDSPVAKRLA